jgi:hypothetical protein
MTIGPGPGPVPANQPAMLADAAARERAADVLRAGLAEGRLTRAEHDERTARVHAARTYGDLAPLVADLPCGVPGAVVYNPAPVRPAAWGRVQVINSLAVASLICGLAEIPTLGLTALPAIILADKAREQIRATGERGEGLALAGQALGWTAVVLFFSVILAGMTWLALPPAPGTGGPFGGG